MTHSRQGRRGGMPRLLLLATAVAAAGTGHAYTDEEIDQRFNALQQQVAATPAAAPAPVLIPAEESRYKVSGYFTFGGTGTDQPGGVYARDYADNTDFEVLSRAAVQLEFRIDDDTRFVTQLLSRGSEGWQTRAEWAFLAHNLTDSTTVRAGRLRLPLFLYSETIDAGYTQPWITGPAEMYGILQFSSYEGLDLRYRFAAGDTDWSIQPYFGYAVLDEADGFSTDSRGDELHGIDITMNWNDVTARAGYFGGRLNIGTTGLAKVAYDVNATIREAAADGAASSAAGGAATGAASAAASGAATGACAGNGYFVVTTCPASIYTPAYNAAYNATYDSVYDSTYDSVYAGVVASLPDPDLSVEDAEIKYWSFGLRYDNGALLAQTEYTGSTIEGYFSDLTSCYGMLGYRFGRWMPHLTYSHLRVDDPEERDFSSVAWDPDGPGPAPLIDNPGGAIVTQGFAQDQQSWTLGVRFDPRPGIALKAEASQVGEFTAGSSGRWIPDSAATPLPDEFFVYRASVDVVF